MFQPQSVYISPHRPDDLRSVANAKLYPLRQTPEQVNPTDFQLDPPIVLAPRTVEAQSWIYPAHRGIGGVSLKQLIDSESKPSSDVVFGQPIFHHLRHCASQSADDDKLFIKVIHNTEEH